MADPISAAAKKAAKATKDLGKSITNSVAPSTGSNSTSVARSDSSHVTLNDNGTVQISLPELVTLTPASIAGVLTGFKPEAFKITDVNAIPDALPQSTVEQHSQGMAKLEGAIRNLELEQKAAQMSGKVFDVVGERSTVIGKGFSAANKTDQARNLYLDWMTTLESQKQKGMKLGVEQYRTTIDVQKAPFTKLGLDEDLDRLKSDTAIKQIESERARNNLLKLQSELKGLIGRTIDTAAKPVQ